MKRNIRRVLPALLSAVLLTTTVIPVNAMSAPDPPGITPIEGLKYDDNHNLVGTDDITDISSKPTESSTSPSGEGIVAGKTLEDIIRDHDEGDWKPLEQEPHPIGKIDIKEFEPLIDDVDVPTGGSTFTENQPTDEDDEESSGKLSDTSGNITIKDEIHIKDDAPTGGSTFTENPSTSPSQSESDGKLLDSSDNKLDINGDDFDIGGDLKIGEPEGKHKPSQSKPGYTSNTNGTLNFFINLAGDVLDVSGDSSQHSSSLFTSKLTSEFTVRATLQEDVFESSYYSINEGVFDSIVGEDEDDYENIDAEIRSILPDYIDFPSDSAILNEVKNQIADGAQIQTVNGTLVSESLIADDYYDVYWYVLKEGYDYWHVDGILVQKKEPQVKTYDVEYEWTFDRAGLVSVADALTIGSSQTGHPILPTKVTYRENDLVTVNTTYKSGDTVPVYTPQRPEDSGYAPSYEFVFSGWDKSVDFNITEDTTIKGVWTLRAIEQTPQPKTYDVTYKWTLDKSGLFDSSVNLNIGNDNTGLIKPPTKATYNENDLIVVDTTFKMNDVAPTDSLNGIEYEWVFSGWDKTGSFNITEDTEITGVWKLRVKEQTPQPTVEEVTYTINYLDVDNGNQLATPTTGTLSKGTEFHWYGAVEYPSSVTYLGGIYQYVYSDAGYPSSDISVTEDTVINCYYRLYSQVTVRYIIKDTETRLRSPEVKFFSGHGNKFDPTTVKYDSLEYDGKTYIYDSTNLDSLESFDVESNKVIDFYYVEKPEDTTPEPPVAIVHKLTQYHKILDTDTEVISKWEFVVEENASWSFPDAPTTVTFDGKTYELKSITGDDKTGESITSDLTRTAWYSVKEEPEKPNKPEKPSKPKDKPKKDDKPVEIIVTPAPVVTVVEDKKDDTPKTGDPIYGTAGLGIISLLGAIVTRRKRKYD